MGQDFTVHENELSMTVKCVDKNYFSLPFPALRGTKQHENAALSVAILDKLRNSFPVGLNHIKSGLLTSTLIGRFQVLPGLPQTILDVAHNPHAVTHMLENMLKLPSCKNVYAVFGIANDKDAATIIFNCRDVFTRWFIAKINNSRSFDPNKIALLLFENGIKKEQIVICENITNAYESAKLITKDSDRIVAFGSFLVVEEVYKRNLNAK